MKAPRLPTRALAAALDARDPYTAGHSERVSTFAVAVADELGLDTEARDAASRGNAARSLVERSGSCEQSR